jgi:hypothetical protein
VNVAAFKELAEIRAASFRGVDFLEGLVAVFAEVEREAAVLVAATLHRDFAFVAGMWLSRVGSRRRMGERVSVAFDHFLTPLFRWGTRKNLVRMGKLIE